MNLNYEFWVSYYDGQNIDKISSSFKEKNQAIAARIWDRGSKQIPCQKTPFCNLQLRVTNPGMLIGLGMAHDSGSKCGEDEDDEDALNSEIRNGFTLDSVTGLPYLPGSSVKGVLRSAFLRSPAYIAELLGEGWDEVSVKQLELDIFGTQHPEAKGYEGNDPAKGNDVFLDAFAVKPDADGHLLDFDYITPHRASEPGFDGLKSPIPIMILRVLPDVVFQFRFKLTDSILHDGLKLNADGKKALFCTILTDLGAGAKTNTGYGGLDTIEDDEIQQSYAYLVDFDEAAAKKKAEIIEEKPSDEIKEGHMVRAYVERPGKKDAIVILNPPENYGPRIRCSGLVKGTMQANDVQEGSTILVDVQSYDEKKNLWKVKKHKKNKQKK